MYINRRNWLKWIAVYGAIALVLYGAIYVVFFSGLFSGQGGPSPVGY